ncbi:MAG TPA: isochorismatase [Acidobacteriota bacterium]|nr:isochorismatase [Acidobacteriota bacterium]
MERRQFDTPPHFVPEKVGEVWRVDYQGIATAATAWKTKYSLNPSYQDRPKVCLLGIDLQNTFCIPQYELFVGGHSGFAAVEDNLRLCRFIYQNLEWITQFVVTMDSHQTYQIFHPAFLENSNGQNPGPFTVISTDDIAAGRWRISPETCAALGVSTGWAQEYIRAYSRKLNESDKYEWAVWPYHAMLGGIGHALVSAFDEAIFFHSIARTSMPSIHLKGQNPWTEHYSALGPEVPESEDRRPAAPNNTALVDELLKFDKVLIAGQAKSHCVAWTVEDLLLEIRDRGIELVEKFYLLEDCTSPVVVPGVTDFTEQADARFEKFRQAGIHVVRSTDPISDWLDTGE